MDCKKYLTKEQIISEFGKDDDLGHCAECSHIKFKDGLMICDYLLEETNKNEN